MAIYHFAWDLEFFGYAEPGLSQQFGWKLFARSIASTFLFLVGVSLFLAHGRKLRWRRFGLRLAQIAAAAVLITAATWFATPDRYIFFGILHQIALASLIGLAFLRLPAIVLILAAAAILAAPHFLRSDLFEHPVFWWLGLSPRDPVSNDYVPLFPWFGAVLAGMAAAKIGEASGLLAWLARIRRRNWHAPLGFIGRHGLAFYLLHQPVLIGCLWLFSQIVPAQSPLPETQFLGACQQSCRETRSEAYCHAYCICVLDRLAETGKLDDILAGRSDTELDSEMTAIAGQCRRATESDAGAQSTP